MSDEFARYAVYWVPRRPDPLAGFGVSWTGWCAECGEIRPRGAFPCVEDDGAGLVGKLWRHGLHGVIRAPFALAPGRSRFAVERALDELAEELVGFQLPKFEIAVVRDRVVLAPGHSTGALAAMMRRVDEALAPLAARAGTNGHANGCTAGRAARIAPDASLVAFPSEPTGRFHVPLTDPMPVERAHALRDTLAPLVAPMLGVPRRIAELALMGDPGGGRPLRVLQRYELLDWPLRRAARALPCHGPRVLARMPERGLEEADAAV